MIPNANSPLSKRPIGLGKVITRCHYSQAAPCSCVRVPIVWLGLRLQVRFGRAFRDGFNKIRAPNLLVQFIYA